MTKKTILNKNMGNGESISNEILDSEKTSNSMIYIKKTCRSIALMFIILSSTFCFFGCTQRTQYDFLGYAAQGKISSDEEGIVSMEEVQNMIELDTWYFTSGVSNNFIILKYPSKKNEKITFECTATKGKIYWKGNKEGFVKKLTVEANNRISWQWDYENVNDGEIYIDIILKKDKKIIGYAVIEIEEDGSLANCKAEIIKNAVFPKINGKYQKITEEYVSKVMDKIKKE